MYVCGGLLKLQRFDQVIFISVVCSCGDLGVFLRGFSVCFGEIGEIGETAVLVTTGRTFVYGTAVTSAGKQGNADI